MTRVRRLLAIAVLAVAGSSLPAAAQPSEAGGVAVLPLRSRGISVAEHRKIAARLSASFEEVRQDVVKPEDLAARLVRDERRRGALEEARTLVAEGAERSLNLESAAAISAYDRALALWRENFGEWADPFAMADAYVRRAAERMDSDAAAAKADLFAAVTIAPDRMVSIDDFPPRVVEAYEAARLERARNSFAPDDPRVLAALGAALGTATVAVTRAERGDRIEEGVGVEVAVFAVQAADLPPKTRNTTLQGSGDSGLERIDTMIESLAGHGPVAIGRTDLVRTNPARTPPVRRPRRPGDRPLWKNPWVWAGTGAAALLGAGFGVYTLQQERDEGPGFKVILAPAPPEDP